MSCAKTDEPIEIPFGVWTNVSPLNHVLDEGPDSRRGRVNCRVSHAMRAFVNIL